MRHVNYRLKPLALDRAKPAEKVYSLTDGGGLLVDVLPSGSKVWRFKYHWLGRREKVTIGRYPELSIKEARDRHAAMRQQLEEGISPAATRRAARAVEQDVAARDGSFRALSDGWVADRTKAGRSGRYVHQSRRWLEMYVYPVVGDLPADDVKPKHVLAVIERAKESGPVLPSLVCGLVSRIFRWGQRKLLVENNPAAAMGESAPRPRVKHHKFLRERDIGAMLRALRNEEEVGNPVAAIGAQLLLLTMARKNELRQARWSEFDLVAAEWVIPAERMKMGFEHRVPLSRQALALLERLRDLTGPYPFVLASLYKHPIGSVPIGNSTLTEPFHAASGRRLVPHGARGTGATHLRECGIERDVVELLLAHREKDKTVAAYSHMERMKDRRAALQFLADEYDRLAAGAQIIRLHAS